MADCKHESASDRDEDGWVICWSCGAAVKRPLSMDEIVERLEERQ